MPTYRCEDVKRDDFPRSDEIHMLTHVITTMNKCKNLPFKVENAIEQIYNHPGKPLGQGAFGTVWGINNFVITKEGARLGPYNIALKIGIYDSEDDLKNKWVVEKNYAIQAGNAKIGPDIYGSFWFRTIFKENGVDRTKYLGIIIMQRYDQSVYDFLLTTNEKKISTRLKRMVIRNMFLIIQKMAEIQLFCLDIKPANFVIRRVNIVSDEGGGGGAEGTEAHTWDMRMIDFGTNGCGKRNPVARVDPGGSFKDFAPNLKTFSLKLFSLVIIASQILIIYDILRISLYKKKIAKTVLTTRRQKLRKRKKAEIIYLLSEFYELFNIICGEKESGEELTDTGGLKERLEVALTNSKLYSVFIWYVMPGSQARRRAKIKQPPFIGDGDEAKTARREEVKPYLKKLCNIRKLIENKPKRKPKNAPADDQNALLAAARRPPLGRPPLHPRRPRTKKKSKRSATKTKKKL